MQFITEGGHVFKTQEGAPLTQRIAKADVLPTVKWLEQLTGLPLAKHLLGTTGKAATSSDIDVAVDANKVSKDELIQRLVPWAKQQQGSDPKSWIKKSGDSVHLRTPIKGNPANGFVQTDFMFGEPDWMTFSLKGGLEGSQYKGMHRHILLASLAKSKGYRWSYKNGLANRETGETITKDPKVIAEVLLGQGATSKDLESVESILDKIKQLPNYKELIADARETLKREGLNLPESIGSTNWFRSLSELVEGGWRSTKTQETNLTPALVAKTMHTLTLFVTNFNQFLKANSITPIELGEPLGSTSYYKQDLRTAPNKTYGDIDVMVVIPRPEGMTNAQAQAFYTKMILEFLRQKRTPYVDAELNLSQNNAQFLIAKVGKERIQVDLIWTFESVKDWTTYKMRPEYNQAGEISKGKISRQLYTTLATLLDLSIGQFGVQIKIKDDEPVSFRQQKVDQVDTITTDIGTFALDILAYLFKKIYPNRNIKEMQIAEELSNHPGLKRDEILITDLVSAIKGLGKSFELNDMYGKYNLKALASYDDFRNKFLQHYLSAMQDAIANTKYEKAMSPSAIKHVDITKKLLTDYAQKIQELFQS